MKKNILLGLLTSTGMSAIIKLIVLGLLTLVGISALIGLIWSIPYLIYSRNLPTALKIFVFSIFGGVISAINSRPRKTS